MNLVVLGGWFTEIFYTLWLLICDAIYLFISFLYQVFEKVASVNLFSEEVFDEITGRLYVVIGLAMLFIFAYNIVLAIINPDGKDKGTTNLAKSVKETIISLVIVVLLPTIFNYMYIFQSHILETNVIGTIILGGAGSNVGLTDINGDKKIDKNDIDKSKCAKDDYDCTCDFSKFNLDEYYVSVDWWFDSSKDVRDTMSKKCVAYRKLSASKRGAYSIAPTIFSTFYSPSNYSLDDCVDYLSGKGSSQVNTDEKKQICVNYFSDLIMSKYDGNINYFVGDGYLKELAADDNPNFKFHWLMAIVAGVLAVYMFLCYTLEIGVRVAKLGFLQLISPIPVMMRIIPGQKEKVFDKWVNNLKNTYLDVFFRLFIIYFALFAISLVPDVLSTLNKSVWSKESNWFINMLAGVIVILGLLKFAQDAPKLIKEMLGGMGDFALRSPRKQLQENKLAMGGIGMAAGGLQNMAGNYYKATHDNDGKKIAGSFKRGLVSATGGLFGGARRGAIHGYRTNDFRNLSGELKQAKYETDEARARRSERVATALEHNYKGPLKGVAGGAINAYEGLGRYIKTDGAGKVTATAAQAIHERFKKIDDKFVGSHLKTVKDRRKEAENVLAMPSDGQSVFDGEKYFTFKDGLWRNGSDILSYEELDSRNKAYEHNQELCEKASVYIKRHDEFCTDLSNALTKFSVDSTNLPYDKLSGIISSIVTDAKINVGGVEYTLPNTINNVDDLKAEMNKLAKSTRKVAGEYVDLMLVAEVNDLLTKKLGSLSGHIAGLTDSNDVKDKK